jgi:cell shape-determining protein MreC
MNYHSFWLWAARVLPLLALFILALLYLFPDPNALQIFWCSVLVITMGSAISWWWWIMDTVKKFFTLIENQIQKFDEVKKEIKSVKEDLDEVKKTGSSRKRTKS